MARWKDSDIAKLSRCPIFVGKDHWLYENPHGLTLHCDHRMGKLQGAIPIQTIKAYIRRWEKAKREMK